MLTSPVIASGLASRSGSSLRNDVATACRASSGQALNQSMVQQVTSDGNCLSRARNTSPIGLQGSKWGKSVWKGKGRQKIRTAIRLNIPLTKQTKLCSYSPHAEHDVDVATDPPNVGSHKVGLSWLLTQFLHHRLHGYQDALLLVWCIQIGHVSWIQNVVYILQEWLTLDLRD